MLGLGAAVVVGAALGLAAGRDPRIPIVLSCALAGIIVYGIVYAIPAHGLSVGWPVGGMLIHWTSSCTGVPALAGAMLSQLALALVSRLRRSSGR
ncbi:MAG: hypothetical protein M3338_04850 [Actinomycetota bacterium]|nr:hypothetical protein [Actinomycetota bacterium]